jgi:hypothetical protein
MKLTSVVIVIQMSCLVLAHNKKQQQGVTLLHVRKLLRAS